ncbi:DUF6364 family protein [Belliella aquatica]|uniref:CopG family transcriptional regulator n=1 Tax=Belliella aquatica TaxID=1323734 RepID=A0ABQ1M963_9BACT|nr:DUF6364 family protein [Belliella aquatica]MCH7405654.1 DUF6364 family protein [Belliella aquatica]GGC36748.1 hypothetical protein GCM10010993_14460 [Belliella aquatica]
MSKLTLSIDNQEVIDWAKSFAKDNNTSVSSLVEKYLLSLKKFNERELILSDRLKSLKDAGLRPSEKEIEKHLSKRRKRQM